MEITTEQIKSALDAHEPTHGKICVHFVDAKPVALRYSEETKWGVIGRMIGHTKDDPIATIDFLMTEDQLQDTVATLITAGITMEIAGAGFEITAEAVREYIDGQAEGERNGT